MASIVATLFIFLALVASTLTVVADEQAPQAPRDGTSCEDAHEDAVCSSSLGQAGVSVTLRAKAVTEDPFDDLEDAFDVRSHTRGASFAPVVSSAAVDLSASDMAFWISCTQDVLIFLIVGVVVHTLVCLAKHMPPTTKQTGAKTTPATIVARKADFGALMQAAQSGDESC